MRHRHIFSFGLVYLFVFFSFVSWGFLCFCLFVVVLIFFLLGLFFLGVGVFYFVLSFFGFWKRQK